MNSVFMAHPADTMSELDLDGIDDSIEALLYFIQCVRSHDRTQVSPEDVWLIDTGRCMVVRIPNADFTFDNMCHWNELRSLTISQFTTVQNRPMQNHAVIVLDNDTAYVYIGRDDRSDVGDDGIAILQKVWSHPIKWEVVSTLFTLPSKTWSRKTQLGCDNSENTCVLLSDMYRNGEMGTIETECDLFYVEGSRLSRIRITKKSNDDFEETHVDQ